MLDITLNGAEPTHVDRLSPQFSVDANGKITWVPGLLDYDASLFYRGKTVTNEEFNTLFLRNVYQGNYITDSLSELFDKHLDTAIYRSFTSDFNLVPSYVKAFSASDWGALQDDGYYYLTITAEEHGFNIDEDVSEVNHMNIDTEMYVLGTDGRFYEVTQVDTDPDNTVRLYTDDNTITGFVVIRTNDKAYALAAATIDATQVVGLAPVATSAKYTDLIDRTTPTGPDTRIAANAAALASIISDTAVDDGLPFVRKADYATNAENAEYATNLLSSGTIQNQPISAIFEEASSTVKKSTTATNVDLTIAGVPISNIFEMDGTTVKEATHAKRATSADNASQAQYTHVNATETIETRLVALQDSRWEYVSETLTESELYAKLVAMKNSTTEIPVQVALRVTSSESYYGNNEILASLQSNNKVSNGEIRSPKYFREGFEYTFSNFSRFNDGTEDHFHAQGYTYAHGYLDMYISSSSIDISWFDVSVSHTTSGSSTWGNINFKAGFDVVFATYTLYYLRQNRV